MTENQLCSFQSSLDKLRWKDNTSLPLPLYAHPNKSEKWKTLRILSNIRIPSESMYNAEKHLLKKCKITTLICFLIQQHFQFCEYHESISNPSWKTNGYWGFCTDPPLHFCLHWNPWEELQENALACQSEGWLCHFLGLRLRQTS